MMIFVLVLVSTVAAIYTGYQGLPLYWIALIAVVVRRTSLTARAV